MLQAGDVVGGQYIIERRIANGGMSAVYLAHTECEAVKWAVKEARVERGEMRFLAAQSLQTEIEALKRLDHPAIAKVVDVVVEERGLYMVMEYVEGRTLEQIYREDGAFTEEETRAIGVQIADAIGYLHSRKDAVVYRDLKPSNLILRPDGRVALIDFGTALTFDAAKKKEYAPFGTRGYAAPEQYGRAKALTEATDIYALGRTLTALLKRGKTSTKRLRGVSRPMRLILRRCTRKNPLRRYKHVAETYYDLRNIDALGLRARMTCAARLLLFLMFFVPAAALCGRDIFGEAQTLSAGVGFFAVSALIWYAFRTPDALFGLLGLSAKWEILRRMKSARVNGVFQIGKHMPTKEAIAWQDVEIPLDEPMTDVRVDFGHKKVNFIVMDGFRLEQDVMVTLRENYRVIS